MLVGISGELNNESVTSVTYNGINLILVEAEENVVSNDASVQLWQLVAPVTGTHNVIVNLTGGGHNGVVVGVTTFTEVNQTDPILAVITESGDSSTPSVTLPSASDELVFGVVSVHSGSGVIPISGQREVWDVSAGHVSGSGSVMGGAASVTSSWSTANKDWSAMAASIQSVTTAHHPESFSAVQDAFIREQSPTTNYGFSNSMTVDGENNKEQRGLVQFDLGTIQSGATIKSAYLKLDASKVDDDITLDIYQLTESWAEGSTTWNDRSAGTNWSVAGGAFNATPVVSKTLQYEQTGSQYFNITALVQDWVDGDEENYGIMFSSSSKWEAIFDTREGATPPELVLVYTSPNEAPVNTVPGTQTVNEETQTAINGISVADPDAGDRSITTQLSVGNGVLDVTLSGSATISAGTNGSASLTISGSVADINATLASVLYTGDLDVNGTAADTLTIITDDLGNAGTGGAKSDTDTVQIDISNVNDAPVITDGPDTAGLTETNAGLITSGDLTVSDVDTTDVVTATVDSVTSSGNTSAAPDNATLLNMLSVSPATILDGTQNSASLGWTFNSGTEAFDYLAAGETLVLEYTIRATDDGGGVLSDTETVTITITGSNDDPVFSIVDVVGDITEGATLTDSGSITFTDLDGSDTPTATEVTQSVNTTKVGGLTGAQQTAIENAFSISPDALNANDGTINWTYTITEGELDFLAAGETVTAMDVVGDITEGTTLSDTGSITFADLDLTDLPTAIETTQSVTTNVVGGLTGAQQTAIENAFSISPDALNANNGTINWTYTITEGELDFLAAGETVTAVFTITVNDANGGTDTQDVTINITGANDVPVITVVDVVGDITEGTTLSDTGSITFADLDGSDRPTATEVTQSVNTTKVGGLTGAQQTAIENAFSISPDALNTNNGTINWTYTITEGELDFLAAGETVTAIFTITVNDANGGTDTQDVTHPLGYRFDHLC